MNIGSGNGYPSSALSNFAPHRFVYDGVSCASMEGFLQSLKFSSVPVQEHICGLVGRGAKAAGRKRSAIWRQKQVLWWKGSEFDRHSEEYQLLLDDAYTAMYEQSGSFRKALEATGNAVLTHTIGSSKASETVLTEREFCNRLHMLRKYHTLKPLGKWLMIS